VKKKLLLISFALLAIGVFEIKTASSNSNGRAVKTGAPGEGTCRDCHNSNALNASGGSVVISAPDLINGEYNPGQIYTIDVIVERNGLSEFGFGFEALQTNGSNAGSLTVTNTAEMHVLTGTIGGNVRNTMTHKTNAGLAANTKTFSFEWSAPAAGTGNVGLYASGNAVNQSGNTSGDFVYTTSLMLTEATPSGGFAFNSANANLSVFPNPVATEINVSFNAGKNASYLIQLLELKSGAIIHEEKLNAHVGNNRMRIANNSWTPGVYLLSLSNGERTIHKKIVIQ
jgi:hypothetical protein